LGASEELAKFSRLATTNADLIKSFGAFDATAMADGALPSKTKELIAVAVALTTQCQYCLTIHSEYARKAGATDEELAEAIYVAAALRAGAAVIHGVNHVLPPD
jgi:AhpD family alkylhydroperoxidase